MNINEFSQNIQDVFGFLVSDFGFEVVFLNESGQDNRCLMVGLESPKHRVKFYAESGISILIADKTAQFDFDDPKKPLWYRVEHLCAFLEKRAIQWVNFKNTVSREHLEKMAEELKPKAQHLFQVLQHNSNWQAEFRLYESEEKNRYFSGLGLD